MSERRLGLNARGLPHATKAVDVIAKTDVGVAGIFVVPVAGTAALGAKSPGPAANDLGVTGVRSAGVVLRGLLVIINFVEIVAPFPEITGDVEQTPSIGWLLAHSLGMAAGILFEPGVLAKF